MAVEPPVTPWSFPDPAQADADGVVGVGADLEPGTILAAYRSGLFPMPIAQSVLAWWSPDPRGIIPVDQLHISRSLARSLGRFTVTVDNAFEAVIDECANPRRPHGWISGEIRQAYVGLHELGWAHSVEVWDDEGLAGGLYGIGIGGLFAGESMFHRRTDASKVALVGLVDRLDHHPDTLLDVQWATDHLRTLGCVEVSRRTYLDRLARALKRPTPTQLG
ncbi:MAG: leucyl/phenylalanyl-tRNA--protein transferase [Actinomycetia bacterium]|nr:leucyl/phenylalanyl-tRNA--protein transferase [Actinomycetes bacterium]MCP3913534.1 leucyl/phenylalanyl-tRNA--protein transferase [Actinomycetes bacterium]MCP4086496.1 leucyl/phenylalanyl-tRNA--protein transferase [Actinomycetes bacterium]